MNVSLFDFDSREKETRQLEKIIITLQDYNFQSYIFKVIIYFKVIIVFQSLETGISYSGC